MPLVPGQTLTSYEIVAPLGKGGMGEVYQARDTKLGREVAIKVLPDGFADDAERMARFEREAKVPVLPQGSHRDARRVRRNRWDGFETRAVR